MTNAEITAKLFQVTDAKTVNAILDNVAAHYGITRDQARAEVTDAEAESLLDYVTGPARAAARVIMQRHNLAK